MKKKAALAAQQVAKKSGDEETPDHTNDSFPALRALCAEYGFSELLFLRLSDQIRYLSEWKQAVQDLTLTPKSRAITLSRVEKSAQELRGAIEALPFDLRMKLDNRYFGMDSPEFWALLQSGELDDFQSRDLDLGSSVVPRILMAVQRTAEDAGLAGPASERPGRQSTVEHQADFIRCIATCVKPAGMAPGISGPFRKLCETVFQAAGLTVSERALRHFMSDIRPSVRAAGFCL